MRSPQVLIVGAGPSGLTAALTLLKNGIPVRIIEKDSQYHQGFRGAGVQPRTQEFEYFLGILEDVKKYSYEMGTMYCYDPSDPYKIVRSLDIVQQVNPTPAFPLTKPVVIAQYQHQAVLRDHVERLGGKVELGTSATAIEQDEDGVTVEIVKSNGGTEVTEKSRFAYVIGTDGGRSTIRRRLGIEFHGETWEAAKLYLADVRIKGPELSTSGFHTWGVLSADFCNLNYAGEPGRYQIMLGGLNTDFASLTTNKDLQTLKNEFRKMTKRDDIEITEVLRQVEWIPNIRLAERFRVGRIFIAGDAAHTHSPAGGQGLNSSIGDTFNLGWKLALVVKGEAPPSLLDSYELERIPVISEMLNISTSLHHTTFQQAIAIAKAQAQAQDGTAAVTWKKEDDGFFRGWRLFQLDLNYRHSPLVIDDRYIDIVGGEVHTYGIEGHDIRGGDRAPDAPGLVSAAGDGKFIRAFDLFSPTTHTVLLFSSATAENDGHAYTQSVLSVLKRLTPGLVRTAVIVRGDSADAHVPNLGVDFVLKDSAGHAYKNYGVEDGKSAIVIVRPDAYIGAFVRDAAGVEKYLSLTFGLSAS